MSDTPVLSDTMNTPRRSVRLPDPLWQRVLTYAARRDLTPSEVIRLALDRLIGGKP